MQEVKVWSLIRELRSHMPWDQKKKQKAENKKTMKQKQYYKKFNKDLEKMFHVKKFF